jgi:hypothetical protein
LFVLGQTINFGSKSDVVNPDQNFPNSTDPPKNSAMAECQAQITTFGMWSYTVNKEHLARSGFYAVGEGGKVKCLHCAGRLSNWKPSEDPWEEHW